MEALSGKAAGIVYKNHDLEHGFSPLLIQV